MRDDDARDNHWAARFDAKEAKMQRRIDELEAENRELRRSIHTAITMPIDLTAAEVSAYLAKRLIDMG